MDQLKRKLVANLQGYLRERQDFIASIPTMDPIWTVPLDIIGDLLQPILGVLDGKCPRLFLLFDNIIRSEDIRAGAIQFNIRFITTTTRNLEVRFFFESNNSYRVKFPQYFNDIKAGVYLGTHGCQAFYSIIENILRNSARHSNTDEINKVKKFSSAMIDGKINDYFRNGNEIKVDSVTAKPLIISIEFYDDWDDNYKEYKDDFIKVRIYDNLGGWKQENDEWKCNDTTLTSIKDKLDPTKEEGRIIDETGQIIQGSWGMKEIRICASFLRGLKIPEYENKYPPPIIEPVIVSNIDNTGNLGYEFYLPKPKVLLIVSSDLNLTEPNNDLKSGGIYIEKDTGKLKEGKSTHEFVLIDIDENNNVEFIINHQLELPYKLFYLSRNDNIPDSLKKVDQLYQERIIKKDEFQKWLNDKDLKIELKWNSNDEIKSNTITLKNRAEKITIEIYNKWYKFLSGNEILLRIGLQPREDLSTWEQINLFGFNEDDFNNGIKDKLKGNILFDHQFSIFEKLVPESYPLAIFPFSRTESGKITKTWETLTKGRESIDFKVLHSIFETLECAVVNILVIDERIFDFFRQKKNIAKKDTYLAYYWYLQNVIALNLVSQSEIMGYDIKTSNSKIELQKQPSLVKKNISKLGDFLPKHFENRLHFLIIHRSIIHSSKMEGLQGFEDFLEKINKKYKPWQVVITSGIGHPHKEEMYKGKKPYVAGSKFIHISNLTKLLYENPNKFLLVKTLSALKEEIQ